MIKTMDLVLKDAVKKFTKSMTKVLGINEEFLELAPTELVNLQATNHYLDFVYITKEGVLIDLEFQSKPPTNDDYARFISYKVTLFRQNGIKVKIYIVCVSEIEIKLPIEFDEELYFIPEIISFKDFDCKKIINTTKKKLNNSEKLSQEDLMKLIFTPLMVEENHAEKQIVETVKIFSRLTPKHTSIKYKELKDIGDMLGLLIGKFIKDDKLQEKLLEEIIMITDGFKKLMEKHEEIGIGIGEERGIGKGIKIGEERGMEKLIRVRRLLSENYSVEEVMEKTGLSKKYVEAMK